MEPIEVGEFSEKMEEVGAKHERTMMRVSLIISVLAAMTATVIVLGHREHTEAVLLQAQAGEQWQQLQSRTIRQQQETDTRTILQHISTSGSLATQSEVAGYNADIEKLKGQIDQERKKARELGDEVKTSEDRANRFDLGEALLQISVVLASITLLTKHHRYVVVGTILGAVGALLAVSAFMLQ